MKYTLTFFVAALLAATHLSAQAPVNDNCSGLIDLGTAPACPTTVYTNLNATHTDLGPGTEPVCFQNQSGGRDVWFAFTCPSDLLDFRIEVKGTAGGGIKNPQIALYRGDCAPGNIAMLLCVQAPIGQNSVYIDASGLTPNAQYFVRVSDFATTQTPNWGNFTICVDKVPPIVTVDAGETFLCEGTIYDSGGPDGDYKSNENHVFSICPPKPVKCINFTLEYYNFEYEESFLGLPIGESLTFYDGKGTSGPVLATLTGDDNATNNAAGGGGVCFSVQATSGCLTLQFKSDDIVQFEGFKGHWSCSPVACEPQETMTVKPKINSDEILKAVTSQFSSVSLKNLVCPDTAYATFSYPTDNNELGLKKGLLLTTGRAVLSLGPNKLSGAGNNNLTKGDKDLDFLSVQQGNGTKSQDACIAEFDVFVKSDELAFDYVFGSEEYPEFVNSNYNDIFAFLISGPGITGDPGLGGAKNIAVLPGTNEPIQIESVNNLTNWNYYRNNELGKALQYDGLTSGKDGVTKFLTARSKVQPCETYRLKLAIADRGDGNFDSGVFISEIRGVAPKLSIEFANGIDYFLERCTNNQDNLVIALDEAVTVATTYTLSVSGTAIKGTDYILNVPETVTFQAGQKEIVFPITPIQDGIAEGTENIVVTLSKNFGCGDVLQASLSVDIKDDVEVLINNGQDTLLACTGTSVQLQAQGAQSYEWSPSANIDNPLSPTPTVTPTQSFWLKVTGAIGSCLDTDSIYIQVVDPKTDAQSVGAPNICLGGSVQLKSVNNVKDAGLIWSPAAGLDDPKSPTPTAKPNKTTLYINTVSLGGCSVSDSILVQVDTLFIPVLRGDTTVCQNYPVRLAAPGKASTTKYEWTPAAGLDNPQSASPIATPDATTTYTLKSTSANGFCSDERSLKITVIASKVEIEGDAYRELCLGDSVALSATVTPGGSEVNWSPAFYLTNATGLTTGIKPDESITVVASYKVNNCLALDSVRLRVDSLPASLAIDKKPFKPIYCPGDTVLLLSEIYEPANFPDMKHMWEPFAGQLTPDSNWNMYINATVTNTFKRVTINRGCRDTATVLVPVSEPPKLTATADKEKVCPGEAVKISATVEPATQKIEWEEHPNILCKECPMNTVRPSMTTTYMVKTPGAACPSSASVTVQVTPPPVLATPNNPVICRGQTVLLNGISEPEVTYEWTSAPAGFVSTDPTPTVSPAQNTQYKVKADKNGCVVEQIVNVTVAVATLSLGEDKSVCSGDQITLTAATTGTSGVLLWSPGGQTTPSITVRPSATGVFRATLTYGNNCQTADTVLVTVKPRPILSEIRMDPDGGTICIGQTIELSVSATGDVSAYQWTQNGENVGDEKPLYKPSGLDSGYYEIKVVAINKDGCSSNSLSKSFELKECFQLPNAFSPDDDGMNEDFTILEEDKKRGVKIVNMQVYNRWGQKVFETNKEDGAWDGKVNDKEQPIDVYIYLLRVKFDNGEERVYKGEITLIR